MSSRCARSTAGTALRTSASRRFDRVPHGREHRTHVVGQPARDHAQGRGRIDVERRRRLAQQVVVAARARVVAEPP